MATFVEVLLVPGRCLATFLAGLTCVSEFERSHHKRQAKILGVLAMEWWYPWDGGPLIINPVQPHIHLI